MTNHLFIANNKNTDDFEKLIITNATNKIITLAFNAYMKSVVTKKASLETKTIDSTIILTQYNHSLNSHLSVLLSQEQISVFIDACIKNNNDSNKVFNELMKSPNISIIDINTIEHIATELNNDMLLNDVFWTKNAKVHPAELIIDNYIN